MTPEQVYDGMLRDKVEKLVRAAVVHALSEMEAAPPRRRYGRTISIPVYTFDCGTQVGVAVDNGLTRDAVRATLPPGWEKATSN